MADDFLWGLILILGVNLYQRKFSGTNAKRLATIYIAALYLLFNIVLVMIITYQLNPIIAIPAGAIIIAIGVLFREKVWPYKRHCVHCGKKLDQEHILGHDDNLCFTCHLEANPVEAEEYKKKEEEKRLMREEQEETKPFIVPDTVDEMDWDSWDPEEKCTLVYLIDKERVLLIHKKQGMGTGLVNGPGGHIEETETADEAAYREFKEETGLNVHTIHMIGELNFQFKDGISMRGYVYLGDGYDGELASSDETTPFWCNRSELPMDKMWEDDRLWLERALQGDHFKGYFIFDDQTMLSQKITFDEE